MSRNHSSEDLAIVTLKQTKYPATHFKASLTKSPELDLGRRCLRPAMMQKSERMLTPRQIVQKFALRRMAETLLLQQTTAF